jgi:hypothetical protein
MAKLKTFHFGDGIDGFYIAATTQRKAYDLFCQVGDSRISFYHFKSRLGTLWGTQMTGIAPVDGGVWSQRPYHGGPIKREL